MSTSDHLYEPIFSWLDRARRHPGPCPREGARGFGPRAPRHSWVAIEQYNYRYAMRWTGSLASMSRCFWCNIRRSTHRHAPDGARVHLITRYWTMDEWDAFYDKIDRLHDWAHTRRRPAREFKLAPEMEVAA